MPLNSVNTNVDAMIALQSLNLTEHAARGDAEADLHRLSRRRRHR